MTIEINDNVFHDLCDSAAMAKEQCGIAVAMASAAVGYPISAEESLKQTAKAYFYVRWLTDTIEKIKRKRRRAMSYDFTAAVVFLENEVATTPEQLREEIWAAWCDISDIENKRNSKIVAAVKETLLTCADFIECITQSPHSPER